MAGCEVISANNSREVAKHRCERIAPMVRTVLICGVIIFAGSPRVEAQPQTIRIMPMGIKDPSKAEYISGECTTDARRERMSCDFVQVALWRETTPETAAAENEKQIREITATEIARFRTSGECRAERLQAMRAASEGATGALRSHLLAIVDAIEAACRNPTQESFAAFIKATTTMQVNTCKVWVNRFEMTFKKQAPLRWVTSAEPSGLCGVVTVATLQGHSGDSDENTLQWTYSSTKVVTNKGALDICKQLDEGRKPDFSWRESTKALPCQLIAPGAIQVK
jgi:hypothetical protein